MIRTILLCVITAGLTIAATTTVLSGQNRAVGAPASADEEALVPLCGHPVYGADGTMGPIFCVIDNPIALHYYAPMARRTFALGPDASPRDVVNALTVDFKHGGTEPILCSIYQLAAWKNHWHFGVSVAAQVGEGLGFPSGWCREPSFSAIE
ncbi:MAG TPA: hypothetical protein VGG89_17765 [Candidatus Baltobacteraceae bacterium]|jgi:hypothetical protein